MNWSKFYYDFAAAYGTFWLLIVGLAILTQSHINAGAFGLWGFPLLAGFYAFMRGNSRIEEEERQRDAEETQWRQIDRLKERVNRLEHERDPIAPPPPSS